MYDINCFICYGFLSEPITLFCSHSFCKKCLEKASQSDQRCSECREEYSLPLPPINKVLNKHMLKLNGIEVPDSDDESNKPINNNNNNNNQVPIEPKPIEPKPIEPKPEEPKPIEPESPEIINPNYRSVSANLNQLPRDIYVNIFTPFSVRELCRISLVSKSLNKAANDNWLWKYKLIQFSQFSNPERFQYDYKKTYQHYVTCDKNLDKGAAGTFKMTAFRGHQQFINCLDHHGQFMTTGSHDTTVKVWDMNSKKGEAILNLQGHLAPITQVKQLATTVTSASEDGTIKIWDLENGAVLHDFHTASPDVRSISYNPQNNNQLVSACTNEVALWDLRANMRLLKFARVQGNVNKATFNQRSNLLVSTDQGLESWDIRNPVAPLFKVQCQSYQTTNQFIYSFVNSTITKYNITTGLLENSFTIHSTIPQYYLPIHTPPLPPTDMPPPLQTTLPPPPIHMIPNPLPHPQPHPPIQTFRQANFSVTNDEVAVPYLNSVNVYNSKTGIKTHTLSNHTDTVNSVLIDDKKILTAGADNTVKVWDKKSGERLYTLLGGSNQVKPTDPPVVVKGCSQIRFDQSKIIGVFGNLVRVYNFRLD